MPLVMAPGALVLGWCCRSLGHLGSHVARLRPCRTGRLHGPLAGGCSCEALQCSNEMMLCHMRWRRQDDSDSHIVTWVNHSGLDWSNWPLDLQWAPCDPWHDWPLGPLADLLAVGGHWAQHGLCDQQEAGSDMFGDCDRSICQDAMESLGIRDGLGDRE